MARVRKRPPAPSTDLKNLLGRKPTDSEITAWNGAVGWLEDWCERQDLRHQFVPSEDNWDEARFAERLREDVLPRAEIKQRRRPE